MRSHQDKLSSNKTSKLNKTTTAFSDSNMQSPKNNPGSLTSKRLGKLEFDLPFGEFLSNKEVKNVLLNHKYDPSPKILNGIKENVYHVIDNSLNIKRFLANKPKKFYDDCGACV